ncbi:hypothetical protein [Streptomyces sp. KO7888]|uniref:hypothetical protein n=1 Tax=Streptomyces sp. KO7888 TaxID=2602737 RepID=UPI0013F5EB75|nr:hypothetical protein [Streptomyces sp. KO7888]
MRDHENAKQAGAEGTRASASRRPAAPPERPSGLLGLQSTIGNAAVARMVRRDSPAHPIPRTATPVQRALGGFSPANFSEHEISRNESAQYVRTDKFGSYDRKGKGNHDKWVERDRGKNVKHYLIAWKDDDTAILGVKADQSPYGSGGYGLGYPALAGGSSELTGPEMDEFFGDDLPDYSMRDRTLREEVDQELWDRSDDGNTRRPYVLNGVDKLAREQAHGRNVYKVWSGKVRRSDDNQPVPPRPAVHGGRPDVEQAKQLAYHENSRTFEAKVSDIEKTVGPEPKVETVLRAVAGIAGVQVPSDVSQDEQAKIYLSPDNYPLHAFAEEVIEKIRQRRVKRKRADDSGSDSETSMRPGASRPRTDGD